MSQEGGVRDTVERVNCETIEAVGGFDREKEVAELTGASVLSVTSR
jgi:hypothetical protein